MTEDIYELPEVTITEEEDRSFDAAEALILCLLRLGIRVRPEVLEATLLHQEVTREQIPALMDFAGRCVVLTGEEEQSDSPITTPRMLGAMLLTRAELQGAFRHEREKEALRFRFGLEDGTPHTLEDTACHMGVSRDRIRLIEQRIFRRCMYRRRSQRIRKFLM